jgi:hypothetical protein
MARIRSVKPELRTSLTVAAWPREVRYAWVLLWGYLDDYGRGKDDLLLMKADMFPLDRDVTERKLDRWLDLMAEKPDDPDEPPPLCRYVATNGQHYLHAVKWGNHQRVSHPNPSRIPHCTIHESFENGSGGIPE